MKRKTNFSLEALLSGLGAVVILILIAAGVFDALRRRLLA